jgi:hypothetical protein
MISNIYLQNNLLLFWKKKCWSYLLMHMVFWIYWKKGTLTKALKNLFYKNRRKDSQEIKRIREKDDLFRLTEPNS